MDPRRYAEVDRKLGPIDWVRRDGDVFEASFACVPVAGGTRVTRRIAFGFAAPLRWLAEPLVRRKLRADVEAEVRGPKRLLEH